MGARLRWAPHPSSIVHIVCRRVRASQVPHRGSCEGAADRRFLSPMKSSHVPFSGVFRRRLSLSTSSRIPFVGEMYSRPAFAVRDHLPRRRTRPTHPVSSWRLEVFRRRSSAAPSLVQRLVTLAPPFRRPGARVPANGIPPVSRTQQGIAESHDGPVVEAARIGDLVGVRRRLS